MNVYSRIWPIWLDRGARRRSRDAPPARMPRTGFPGPLCPAVPRRRKRRFLSAADYAGTADSAFAWDEFKHLSLDAALDDEDRQGIRTFWDRTCPC